MTTYSMTAFARNTYDCTLGQIICEIKSVNHRYLDISTRLNHFLREFEPDIKTIIKQRLTRGKVDCSIIFEPKDSKETKNITIDENLAVKLITVAQQINTMAGNDQQTIDPMAIMRHPGVLKEEETLDNESLKNDLIASLNKALDNFVATREREGEQLKNLLLARLVDIEKQTSIVQKLYPDVIANYRQKLIDQITETKIKIDENRLEQEMIHLAQKIDIAEELDRIHTHIKETRRVLNTDEAIGRRLDFLMQEFNREANTLSSKSISADITKAAVEIKVSIEQMREQVQNIE